MAPQGKDPTSVPLYGLAYGLYYNKQMFADAGSSRPPRGRSWSPTPRSSPSRQGRATAWRIEGGSYTENVHFAFIFGKQNGAEWFDSDGKPTFTSAGQVAGVKRYLDLMQTDKVVNPPTRSTTTDPGGQRLRQRARSR